MQLYDPEIRRAMRGNGAPQQTAAWYQARTGAVTCSRLNDVLDRKKDGSSSQKRIDYLAEKIAERLTGDLEDHYTTASMQRGIDLEPIARSLYEARRGVKVRLVGLMPHHTIPYFAGSPDGLLGDDGMIEIKTCATRTRFLNKVMYRDYSEYTNQIQGLLACTGRDWCDLIIYDDRFAPEQSMHIARIERNEPHILLIEESVRSFLLMLDDMTKQAEHALGGAFT